MKAIARFSFTQLWRLSAQLWRFSAQLWRFSALLFAAHAQADTQLLWGDTHLHTSYSFDAFLNANLTADPDTAYRYARGLPVVHPLHRARVQIETPLDFLVVSDHAEFYGGIRDIYLSGIQDDEPGLLERIAYWYNERQIRGAIDEQRGPAYFVELLPRGEDPIAAAKAWAENLSRSTPPGAQLSVRNAWERLRQVSDRHNAVEDFTALLGWEWSSIPGGANLHRVIVTDADGTAAGQFLPYSSTVSPHPDDLWRWLAKTEQAHGVRFVSIPHNPNISKGFMFGKTTLRGEPVSADYARLQQRFETIAEVTQIKGDSETHPALSPDDPFADFEDYSWHIERVPTLRQQHLAGSFARSGLRNGLAIEQRTGENPYRFGMIGSTDSHTGMASAEEQNFWGKMARDSIPENKQGNALGKGPTGWTMQAGSLAAVWATENSRSAIVDAMLRREVYATTGSRIALRLFGGAGFKAADLEREDFSSYGYAAGVPMGGELKALAAAPRFLVRAQKDPKSGNLDRIQIVKGWIEANGETRERIYDVAAEPGRARDASGAFVAVGDTVDRETGHYDNRIGAANLSAYWQDPDFDPDQAAFYYVRVLEIPTPRHSTLDAIALGQEPPKEWPAVIQERAYSSPIWYRPDSS